MIFFLNTFFVLTTKIFAVACLTLFKQILVFCFFVVKGKSL